MCLAEKYGSKIEVIFFHGMKCQNGKASLAVHTIPWCKIQHEIVNSSDLFDWKYF